MKNIARLTRIPHNALSKAIARVRLTLVASSLGFIFVFGPTISWAQDETRTTRTSNALLEEVVVTARKREESIQDVPLSVTAFDSDQIDVLKVRDLASFAVGIPNVALDDLGTFKGTASFSIRGLGVNSSIPSIDPTVGVFVDGVYMGINAGILVDTFDLKSVQVLRGPQGILFGHNVTGGAILLISKSPGDELEVTARASVEGGGAAANYYLTGSVGGPMSDTVGAKLTVHTNQDGGWFEDSLTGAAVGEADTWMVRPVFVWQPSDTFEVTLRYEYQKVDADGPATQSHTNGSGVPNAWTNSDRDSHDFAIDEVGFQNTETNFVSAQFDWDVAFGDGTVTNVFGWRDFESTARSDIDGSEQWLFHAPVWTNAEQFSNELRYNGVFSDKLNLTTGVYYFTNEINYHERRELLGIATGGAAPALTQDGGGDYEVTTLGLFLAMDYGVSDKLTLSGGVRYTDEDKQASIASLIFNVNSPCNVVEDTCSFDFVDENSWTSWSPKFGLTYQLTDDTLAFAHWTRGYRSGGYNLRNTSGDIVNNGPGPFDQEQVDNYEIGFKASFGSRGYLNGALFLNQIRDMQREVNESDPFSGVVQIIKNTADADILGSELEGAFGLTENLVFRASFGWIDAEYTEVKLDLNGDGTIDELDKGLALPRAAKWTYSVGLTHDLDIGNSGHLSSRINYGYRDDSAFTDSNLGYILDQRILDAGFDFHTSDGRWVVGLYGKNLLDEVKHGGDTQLPTMLGPLPLGGTFSPLAKGRIYGLEFTYTY